MNEVDWDAVDAVDAATRDTVRQIVARHRSVGILTWALMHRMEEEVATAMLETGEHPLWAINMLRSRPVFGYPSDDRPVTFGEDSVAPLIFARIEKAWNLVH